MGNLYDPPVFLPLCLFLCNLLFLLKILFKPFLSESEYKQSMCALLHLPDLKVGLKLDFDDYYSCLEYGLDKHVCILASFFKEYVYILSMFWFIYSLKKQIFMLRSHDSDLY